MKFCAKIRQEIIKFGSNIQHSVPRNNAIYKFVSNISFSLERNLMRGNQIRVSLNGLSDRI